MSAGRPASAHLARRVRKKGSGKKKSSNLTALTRRGSLGNIQGDRYHRTSFPLVMDLPMSDGELHSGVDVPMDATGLAFCGRHRGDKAFPFQALPDVCKFKVWSFLKQCDLGRCMLVCKEWYMLVQKPQLWSSIRFSDLSYYCLPYERSGSVHNEPVCHHCFRKRVFSFSQLLSIIKPAVREFQFCLDISHPTDQFLRVVEEFAATAKLTNLRIAHINWKESPSRQPMRNYPDFTFKDYLYRFRRRQRLFVNFFDNFTLLVPNITTLVVPFDWSERSVASICRLSHLEKLVLEQYGVYTTKFDQKVLNILLRSLDKLKKLLIEVWISSSLSINVFSIISPSLTYLDISQCRGFYLREVSTPLLQHLRIARQVMNNNILWQQVARLPCIQSVLSTGAPGLQDINGYKLSPGWVSQTSEQFQNLMSTICCCPAHRNTNTLEIYGL